jgi:hypothetical protein
MITGRNDPCPCGSGKKYKKCCQPKQDVISIEGVRTDNLFTELWSKFSDFMGGSASRDTVAKGFAYFFAAPIDEAEPVESGDMALDWVAFGHRTDQGIAHCEQFAASGKGLTDRERDLLRSWAASAPGFFRVEAVAGRECRLSRLPDGRVFDVRTLGMQLKAGDLISAWLLPVLSTYHFGHMVQDVGPEVLDPLMHLVEVEMALFRRQRPTASWDELFREHWPRLTDAMAMAVADEENAFRISLPPGPASRRDGMEAVEASPKWQEVESLLRQTVDTMGEMVGREEVEGMQRLWRDGLSALQPRVGRPVSWTAAVFYLFFRDVLGEPVTQAEVAEEFMVSPTTVGKYSRELDAALSPRFVDPRYVSLMDPLVRLHWRMHCLEAMEGSVLPVGP